MRRGSALTPDDSTRTDVCVKMEKKTRILSGKRSVENTFQRNTEDRFFFFNLDEGGIRKSAFKMHCHRTVTGRGFILVPKWVK